MVAVIGSDLVKGLITRFGGKLFAIFPVFMIMYQVGSMITLRAEPYSKKIKIKMLENLFFLAAYSGLTVLFITQANPLIFLIPNIVLSSFQAAYYTYKLKVELDNTKLELSETKGNVDKTKEFLIKLINNLIEFFKETGIQIKTINENEKGFDVVLDFQNNENFMVKYSKVLEFKKSFSGFGIITDPCDKVSVAGMADKPDVVQKGFDAKTIDLGKVTLQFYKSKS